MYWYFQEKLVFYIVLFTILVFQISSLLTLGEIGYLSNYGITLISINLLIFFGMIKYAQWVWKKLSLANAIKKVIKYEAIFLFGILVLVLIAKIFHPELW